MKIDKITLYLILLAASSLFLGTANPLIHIPLVSLIYPACLYMLAKYAENAKKALYHGWLAGALASMLCVYWLVVPVHEYGGFPFLLALPIPVVFGFIHGIYAALFCWIMYIIKYKSGAEEWKVIALTFFAWFFVEFIRSWFLTGFTWLNLVSANAAFPILVQGASILGMQGLSAIFALIACAMVANNYYIRLFGFSLLCVLVLFGYVRVESDYAKKDIATAHYALIQGNLLPEDKWNSRLQEDSLNKYLTLSKKAIDNAKAKKISLDFIVFPETALPFFLQDNRYLTKNIMDFVEEYNVPIITGAVSYTRQRALDEINTDIYNSVFLLSPENDEEVGGSVDVVYSKQHLLPFGEYIPDFLDYPIFKIFFDGIGAFTPAENQESIVYKEHTIGMLICYEAIFSYLAQASVAQGAELLINLSNDAWYGYSSAAKQHLDISSIRAIEQDRYMLRATNTGITTLISPYGQIGKSPKLFSDAVVLERVGYRNHKTIYHIIEPYLNYCINLLFFFFMCIVFSRRNTKTGSKKI